MNTTDLGLSPSPSDHRTTTVDSLGLPFRAVCKIGCFLEDRVKLPAQFIEGTKLSLDSQPHYGTYFPELLNDALLFFCLVFVKSLCKEVE
ncbi:hypothetical protein FOZ63_033029 [Perkinsus olseni]|uniref:Uncharacterized protein n=1 Tax=Perkinsus olseni TaxID=32597 RepID=A0A7J6NFT4_PEROL|nr:hypothetical protein FOZ60_010308 [Perkinsus olseni]KAF4709186.1 hypothetical protein FOZ62_000387 [Perkinsus olseni]KAF4741905.1 hypothetical protein FOZ63_033029 [Perkinsus olseni]